MAGKVGNRRIQEKAEATMMERYVWAGVVMFIAILASATALIALGRSAELERLALLAAQGAGFLVNFWLIHRSSKSTQDHVREDVKNGMVEVAKAAGIREAHSVGEAIDREREQT
jgi:hypothetical protein